VSPCDIGCLCCCRANDAASFQKMQQEIQQQGAVLAKLKPVQQQQQQHQHQDQHQQQPVVHAALAMSSVSFPSAAPASELTAHPGDVLQVRCRALSHASRTACPDSLTGRQRPNCPAGWHQTRGLQRQASTLLWQQRSSSTKLKPPGDTLLAGKSTAAWSWLPCSSRGARRRHSRMQ
jgi:hypothetical protein